MLAAVEAESQGFPLFELWGCAVYLIYVCSNFSDETLYSSTST